MPALALSPIGLLLASAMSVINVLTDVARKRALNKRELIPATFWMRVAVALVFIVVLLVQILRGAVVTIRDGGPVYTTSRFQEPLLQAQNLLSLVASKKLESTDP